MHRFTWGTETPILNPKTSSPRNSSGVGSWRGRWSATESLGSSHTSSQAGSWPSRSASTTCWSRQATSRCFYVPPDDQVWVAYIHHTNRRQSDQIGEVASSRVRPIKLLLYYAMRVAYDHNTHKPDRFVVNSEIVKRRVTRYWGVPEEKVTVVYPPVATDKYSPTDESTGDYYLTLSRLDWHGTSTGSFGRSTSPATDWSWPVTGRNANDSNR